MSMSAASCIVRDSDSPSYGAHPVMAYNSENTDPFTTSGDTPRGSMRRRGSLPPLTVNPVTDMDDRPYSAVEGDVEDMLPLVGKRLGKGKGKGKSSEGEGKRRRTFAVIFGNLNLRKRKTSKTTTPSADMDVSPGDLGGAPTQDPFGDENAMDCDVGIRVGLSEWSGFGEAAVPEDAEMEMALGSPSGEGAGGGGPSGGGTSRAVGFPCTPHKRRRSSISNSPRSSPASAKSRRSSPRDTPYSAKSWLSNSSTPSTVSSMASTRSKHMKRRARSMASQAKSIQLLGIEAAGAVARVTKVSENSLRRKLLGVMLQIVMKLLSGDAVRVESICSLLLVFHTEGCVSW
ncbi:hypothetical protein C8T65DRAFT_673297 [Cerioporus squamosus]|nr:hypothetical protein C8T65DRAFT_673297 [Cerioporus squamosus]